MINCYTLNSGKSKQSQIELLVILVPVGDGKYRVLDRRDQSRLVAFYADRVIYQRILAVYLLAGRRPGRRFGICSKSLDHLSTTPQTVFQQLEDAVVHCNDGRLGGLPQFDSRPGRQRDWRFRSLGPVDRHSGQLPTVARPPSYPSECLGMDPGAHIGVVYRCGSA